MYQNNLRTYFFITGGVIIMLCCLCCVGYYALRTYLERRYGLNHTIEMSHTNNPYRGRPMYTNRMNHNNQVPIEIVVE